MQAAVTAAKPSQPTERQNRLSRGQLGRVDEFLKGLDIALSLHFQGTRDTLENSPWQDVKRIGKALEAAEITRETILPTTANQDAWTRVEQQERSKRNELNLPFSV